MKNIKHIGTAFIILLFGIWAVPKIIDRLTPKTLETIGKAPAFELIDQNNKKITNKDYLGKVSVLEFFFSTCPSICPVMNNNMKKIDAEFFGNPNFAIASITIDPDHDTPQVLLAHKKALQITSQNWHFLTGKKDYIFTLSNKGFNIYAGQNATAKGNFEHSGLFALIDKKGNIRCRKDQNNNPIIYYDGLENKDIKAITEDINILLNQ